MKPITIWDRSHTETIIDVARGNRTREEIASNLLTSSSTQEHTQRLILEVLLDIRNLFQNLAKK